MEDYPVSTNNGSGNLKPRKTSSMPRAIVAGSIGNALEWYDYGLYGYFAGSISLQFFPSKDPLTALMLSFIIFGVGFVMRPLGGLIFGRYADKVGRRNALAITIIMMGVCTSAIGLIPSYAQIGVWAPILLTVARLLQGISTGGEWGSAMSFLAEYSTPKNRGFIVSWSQFSIAVGLLMGSAFGTILASVMSPEAMNSWGWRIPFLTGILIAIFGLYVRKNVEETPKYLEMMENKQATDTPLADVFKNYRHEMFLGFGMVIGWTISYWLIMSYMPTYISKILKWPLYAGMSYNTLLLIIFMVAVPFAGILSDKIGRKSVLLIGTISLVIFAYPAFNIMSTTKSPVMMLSVLSILAILEALICGAATVAVTEIFPTHIRCSGIGIGYNITVAAFGGTAPFIATWLIKATGSNTAPTYYLLFGLIITLVIVLFLYKETYKRELN